MRLLRYDVGTLGTARRTPQGYLEVPATISSVGVFPYFEDGKVVFELRPPDEVNNPESIASFRKCPVTNEHPPQLLNPDNTKQYIEGFGGENVGWNGMGLDTDLVFTGRQSIDDIDSGKKKELSPGYTVEAEETAGYWDPKTQQYGPDVRGDGVIRYDRIQRKIRGNHIALVSQGRQGPDVSVKLDGAQVGIRLDDAEAQRLSQQLPFPQGGNVKVKIKLDGIEYEVESDVANALRAEQKRADEAVKTAEQKAKDAEEEKTKVEAKADSLAADLKKLQEARVDDAQIQARVDARLALVATAMKILPQEKHDSLTKLNDVEIMSEVIKHDCPDVKLDGKDAVYIRARFDHSVDSYGKKQVEDLGRNITPRGDAGDDVDPDKARQDMLERNRKALNGGK